MRSWWPAGLVALTLLASGCRLDAEVVVDVEPDGGGTVAATLEIDAELAAVLADAGVDPLGDLERVAGSDDAWTATRTGRAVTLRAHGPDADALERRLVELADGLDAAELAPLAAPRVDVADGRIEVAADAALVVTDAVTELGLDPAAARAALADAVDYTVVVVMPGDVLGSTGRAVPDAPTARAWRVAAGEQVAVRVTGEVPAPAWLRVAVLVGVAGALAVVARAVVSRRRRPRP